MGESTAKKKEYSTKGMSSIARKISVSIWLKRFGDVLFLDFLILVLVCGSYFYYCEKQVDWGSGDGSVTEEEWRDNRYFITGQDKTDLLYVIQVDEDSVYKFPVYDFLKYVFPGAVVLLICQGLRLFFAMFQTSEIRRKLKPLNDLAVKAERISGLSFDTGQFESLEHAIESISPDGPETQIHTGNKDLQSIEVALNNLLKRMKESQRQQARFVSDASHELRTPIAVIQGYVNMLDRWGKEDESVLNESIEALKNESQHMKELVEQLLFLARGDSGRNTLHKVRFDLNTVIREVFEESMMIDQKHKYTFAECPNAFVVGDIAMIKQSVRILVQNGAKYSKEGDTIRFGVKAEGGQVSYSIQDEGIGMRDTEVVHIFERFYRSDQARNGETGGSGLGLSIAKWIVDAHEGVIEVLSRPEIGTRFTVILKKAED